MQISAILSDYDGTLCPTTSIRSEENIIPKELENILWGISEKIPVCVVSSKDFGFLHSKTRFASIISCILGIETVVLRRHIDDWKFFKVKSEPELRKAIIEKQRELQQQDRPNNIHIQTYTTHPFIDIYAVKCDKGMGYDAVISKIPIIDSTIQKVMYLGDSENDNLAFRKADISIGVKSDERLNPTLDCKYTFKFDKLSSFLEKLQNDNFVFSGL